MHRQQISLFASADESRRYQRSSQKGKEQAGTSPSNQLERNDIYTLRGMQTYLNASIIFK